MWWKEGRKPRKAVVAPLSGIFEEWHLSVALVGPLLLTVRGCFWKVFVEAYLFVKRFFFWSFFFALLFLFALSQSSSTWFGG